MSDVVGLKKAGAAKKLMLIILALLVAGIGLFTGQARPVSAAGGEILIEPTSWGVVTAKELDAFKAYMKTRPLPSTNTGNAMVWGTGSGTPGTDSEALAIMGELTGDSEIIDILIKFSDEMLKKRNDPVSGRIIFTGKRELCWPNADEGTINAGYAGSENGTVIMHIADCAKVILKNPSLWNKTVAAGDPYGYGATYKERALKYIVECDKTVEDFIVPNYVKMVDGVPKLYFPDTDGFQAVKNGSADQRGRYMMWNQQMLLNNGFMALAECHELLGNKPNQVALYDRIVKASVDAFIKDLSAYQKDGHNVYTWDYWPGGTTKVEEAGGAHAGYDIMGLYRAYLRGKYGVPAAVLENIANTFNYVVWDEGIKKFHFKVDGTDAGSDPRRVQWSECIPVVEFNHDCYDKIINSDWLSTAKSGALYAARTMWMENRLKKLGVAPPVVPPPAATLPEDVKSANLALGRTYGASSQWNASYSAAKAFDSSNTTRWSSLKYMGADQWIYVDFGSPVTYNNVVLREYINSGETDTRIQSYRLETSDDGTAYNPIPGTDGTKVGALKSIYFTPVTSRYLRFYIVDTATYFDTKTQKNQKREPGLYEFEVYNEKETTWVTSPSAIVFDKKAGAPETVMFRVNSQGRTLNAITGGGITLEAGKDFTTVEESSLKTIYTLTNVFLKTLATGDHTLYLDFATGEDAALTLSVVDTSAVISVSADTAYDKNGSSDPVLPVTVTNNGNTFLGIRYGSYSLVEGRDFTSVSKDAGSTVYNINRASLPYGNTALVFDFNYGTDPSLNMEIYGAGLPCSSNSLEFDRNKAYQADIVLSVTTEAAIKCGDYTLVGGTDYIVTPGAFSMAYSIKKEFLTSLHAGGNEFKLDFVTGKKTSVNIKVRDTTPPISITFAGFNKAIARSGDLPVIVNTSSMSAITCGTSPLIKDTDYSSVTEGSSTTCLIKKDYLNLLPIGQNEFTFKFSQGDEYVLKVDVKDTTPFTSASAIVFNRKDAAIPYSTGVGVTTSTSLALSTITFNTKTLENGKDYTVTNAVYFQNSFLSSLPLGINKMLLNFSNGETASLNIEVYDTTVSPVLSTKSAEYYKNKTGQADTYVVAYTKTNALGYVTSGSAMLVNLQDYLSLDGSSITVCRFTKAFLSALPSGENIITFKKDDGTVLDTFTINVINATPSAIVTAIEISGPDSIQAETGKITKRNFTAKVKNQNGEVMPEETVAWAIYDAAGKPAAKMSFSAGGELTIAGDATKGLYTVKAVSNSNTSVACTRNVTLNVTASPAPGGSALTQVMSVLDGKMELKVLCTEINTAKKIASVNIDMGKINGVFSAVKADANGIKTVTINVEKVPGIKDYEIKLPPAALSETSADRKIEIKTEKATVLVSTNMLNLAEVGKAKNASITVASVDASALNDEAKKMIGNRPVIDISLMVDGVSKSWNNPGAPVIVTMPYKPSAEELKNPENIVVWYIDGAGKPYPVYGGKFTAPDKVVFSITHFSKYAVALSFKTFGDISDCSWAKKQIEVLAAKGIIQGTSMTAFSPDANITRADFITILVKALNLSAIPDSNFCDVNITDYFYEYVGIAKKLGIIGGVGNDMFNPREFVTRQDMMAITAKALTLAKKLETNAGVAELAAFKDSEQIAPYAVQSIASLYKARLIAGNGNNLNPGKNATRAEIAVFMYKLLNQ